MIGPAACRSVVLPLEHLAALDLYLWLGNEGTVSEVLDVHQSTVSRQVRSALKLFNLKLSRSHGHVQLGGDASLLMAERTVHQQARLWLPDTSVRPVATERVSPDWVGGEP